MKAAIFYKTDESINCDRTNIREQIENIMDDPNNFQLRAFNDSDSLLQLIYESLDKPTVGVSVCNVWEDKNTLYYGYYIDITEVLDFSEKDIDLAININKQIVKSTDYNKFGSQLTAQRVMSNLVIVKKNLDYVIENENVKTNTTFCSINEYELLNVLESIFVKDGIVINSYSDPFAKSQGSDKCGVSIYKYIMNPLEHLMLSDPDYAKHYVYHEYEVYNHIMIIIADTREVNGEPNEMASFLSGKPVNGTVYVALYKKPQFDENPPYTSINVKTLNTILSIRKKSAQLTTGMTQSHEEYVNFEKLLELEQNKYHDKPELSLCDIFGESLNIGNCSSTEKHNILT
jgi:hypothetical protein